MPTYFFQTTDNSGPTALDRGFDFTDDKAAQEEGRRLLVEMAKDSFPGPPMDMLSVEIFDAEHKPILEIRLVLEVIPK